VRVLRVESLDDPRIADFRNVRDPELRDRRGLFLAEGRLGVCRLIEDSRFPTRSVLVTPTALEGIRSSLERLDEGTPVYLAEQATLKAVVGYNMHRGCLAVGERGDDADFGELVLSGRERSLLVVLEQLSNPDNVGGVFRNALAFGADAVLLCPRCSDPLYRKAIRVSMGATLRLPFARARVWPGPLEWLRRAGYCLVALHPREPALELGDPDAAARLPGRVALLLGSEAEGLSAEALAAADLRARIAMAPGVDSLNVATASGIAMHQLRRDAASPGSTGERT
jgi:tRNA G18 (ribose-2'-O)-methylase SpoU